MAIRLEFRRDLEPPDRLPAPDPLERPLDLHERPPKHPLLAPRNPNSTSSISRSARPKVVRR
jgi:hypothetical protein